MNGYNLSFVMQDNFQGVKPAASKTHDDKENQFPKVTYMQAEERIALSKFQKIKYIFCNILIDANKNLGDSGRGRKGDPRPIPIPKVFIGG